MQIAVLSGKGGTGKTTISTNLVKAMGWDFVDCDVEEPNGFIFLKPKIHETIAVEIPIPQIDKEQCISCNQCVEICQFHALVSTRTGILFFDKLCHGCGACTLVCPTNAITEVGRSIGKIEIGQSQSLQCMRGILNVGEPMAVPIIHQLKKLIHENTTVVDCAPGSSCTVVSALSDCSFALLVTEPTAFGLHDLQIAVELVRQMHIPFGVIINRWDVQEGCIEKYCHEEEIQILGKLPFERKIARMYSQGALLVEEEEYQQFFQEVGKKIEGVISCNS